MYPPRATCLIVVLGLAFGHPAPAAGQQWTGRRGSPVRLGLACATPHCPAIRGTLLAGSADSLVIRTRETPRLALAREGIDWVQVGRNRHGVRTGAIVGGGLMGLSTGLLAVATCASIAWGENDCSSAGVVLVTLVGAGLGAGVGALIGAVVAPMRWQPGPPATLDVVARALPGSRVGIGVAVPLGAMFRPASP
jgi:hypothetical protein